MQRLPFVSVLFSVLLLSAAEGQVRSSPSGATGVVIGHVYCADTTGPARFAGVMLEPVSDVNHAVEEASRSDSPVNGQQPVLTTVSSTDRAGWVLWIRKRWRRMRMQSRRILGARVCTAMCSNLST